MATSLPPGETVALNGMQMYYVLAGQGEPLVLLHGYTGASNDWAVFVDDLVREYQLVIPDLRGHGRSTNPLREFTHRQAARDVVALLDHLEFERFKAIGISGGGNILLWQRHARGDEQIRELFRQGQAMADQYEDMNFTAASLSTIAARTLIVYGDRDFLYPVHIALELYTSIPHSYLWIIPNGGHVPRPNAPLIPAILPFLRGDWKRK